MKNNKVRFSEIGALNTRSLEIKLTGTFGDSGYEIEVEQSHLLLMLFTGTWFTMNPNFSDKLAIISEVQFEYILNLYSIGIALNSDIIQNFLIQCKGE